MLQFLQSFSSEEPYVSTWISNKPVR